MGKLLFSTKLRAGSLRNIHDSWLPEAMYIKFCRYSLYLFGQKLHLFCKLTINNINKMFSRITFIDTTRATNVRHNVVNGNGNGSDPSSVSDGLLHVGLLIIAERKLLTASKFQLHNIWLSGIQVLCSFPISLLFIIKKWRMVRHW